MAARWPHAGWIAGLLLVFMEGICCGGTFWAVVVVLSSLGEPPVLDFTSPLSLTLLGIGDGVVGVGAIAGLLLLALSAFERIRFGPVE